MPQRQFDKIKYYPNYRKNLNDNYGNKRLVTDKKNQDTAFMKTI